MELIKNDEAFRTRIAGLLKSADFGVSGIQAPSQKSISASIKLLHNRYDEALQCVGHELFLVEEQESKGVQAFLALSASMIDTLNHGKILMVDDLDVNLHPKLTVALVSMYHDPEVNTKGAQLIFSSKESNPNF